MNSEHDQNLEAQLAELTTWNGPSPLLWKNALRQSKQPRRSTFFALPTWSLPKTIAASIALILASAIAIAVISTTQSERFSKTDAIERTVASNAMAIDRSTAVQGLLRRHEPPASASDANLYSAMVAADLYGNDGMTMAAGVEHGSGGGHDGLRIPSNSTSENVNVNHPDGTAINEGAGASSDFERQVIRKATIELITEDVRAAFLKAMHLISEAGGEYVQDSTLSGHDQNTQANFTMRIAAPRLSEVLNELRALGVVQSENLAGEDITGQVIDIEARLRNEQRVETELLQLLENRNDAPLKEVLELREQIARIRMRIENLVAQRDRMSRLVSLATILVIIRTESAPATQPEEPKQQSIADYFSQSISSDWSSGLRFLADTLAGTVRVLVGGLFWWILLMIALLTMRHYLNRREAMRWA